MRLKSDGTVMFSSCNIGGGAAIDKAQVGRWKVKIYYSNRLCVMVLATREDNAVDMAVI